MRELRRMFYRDPIGVAFTVSIAIMVSVAALAWAVELLREAFR